MKMARWLHMETTPIVGVSLLTTKAHFGGPFFRPLVPQATFDRGTSDVLEPFSVGVVFTQQHQKDEREPQDN